MEIKKLTINGKTFEYRINYGDVISIEIIGSDGQKKTLEVLSSVWDQARKKLVFHTSEKVFCAHVLRQDQDERSGVLPNNKVLSLTGNVVSRKVTNSTTGLIQPAHPELVEGHEQGWRVSFFHNSHTFTVIPVTKKKKKTKGESVLPATKSSLDQAQVCDNSFKSPLAGRVTRVLVSAGDQVKKGQPLVIIESMKMENELCADRPAFIKTIFISEGNVVQQNHVLLEFENKKGEENAGAQGTDGKKTVSDRRSSQRA